jgi:hypothetical protein
MNKPDVIHKNGLSIHHLRVHGRPGFQPAFARVKAGIGVAQQAAAD